MKVTQVNQLTSSEEKNACHNTQILLYIERKKIEIIAIVEKKPLKIRRAGAIVLIH